MIHQLRLRTISPELLQEKLAEGKKVAVIDMIQRETDGPADSSPGMPTALRMDPTRLRSSKKVQVPENVEIVLYCSSPKEITSARVAIALRHKGITRVWILEGGLRAWQKLNLPTTATLADAEETAARFGIKVEARKITK